MRVNLKNKKVLVTGGAGFIGSHTVDYLIDSGAKVTIIDNLSTGRKENLNNKAKFYNMNIADSRVENIIKRERPEFIYHFSYYVLVPKSVINPLLDIDNFIGSLRIIKAAKQSGVRKIVFASSGFLYGNSKILPVKETAGVVPVTPYAITKRAIENYLEFHRKTFGLNYVVLRYAAIYGPRQVTGAMADYIRKLYSGKQAKIWGNGEKTRDYVYIDDVIRANILALEIPDSCFNPIFNIGTGKETTLNELYIKIADLLGKKPDPIYLPDRPGEQIRYALYNSKARRFLGWAPEFSLNKGLKNTVDAYVKTIKEG